MCACRGRMSCGAARIAKRWARKSNHAAPGLSPTVGRDHTVWLSRTTNSRPDGIAPKAHVNCDIVHSNAVEITDPQGVIRTFIDAVTRRRRVTGQNSCRACRSQGSRTLSGAPRSSPRRAGLEPPTASSRLGRRPVGISRSAHVICPVRRRALLRPRTDRLPGRHRRTYAGRQGRCVDNQTVKYVEL